MSPLVNVAAGVIWENKKILVAKRPIGKPRGGYWEFPGGKQESGEAIEETLARELYEELGITCNIIVPWQVLSHEYPDLSVLLHFMHVLEFKDLPSAREGQELAWVTPEEARSMNFLPADVQVVHQLSSLDLSHIA